MNIPLKTILAATTLLVATPSYADILAVRTSADQGILVHGNGGAADQGLEVTGDLGSGPSQLTNYVHFTGSTDATVSTTDANEVRLQQGGGQAELTGAVIGGDPATRLQSGDIFLSGGDTFDWIELSFGNVTGTDWIEFTISVAGETDFVTQLAVNHDPNGENKYAFLSYNGQLMTGLHYDLLGGTAGDIRQVRILREGAVAVPEPATWGMMLLGFGAIGFSMRRRRKTYLPQVA